MERGLARQTGSIVDCPDDLTGCLVFQSEIMRKVIFRESIVIRQEPFYASIPLCRSLSGDLDRDSGHCPYLPAVFLPPFESFFLLSCQFCCHILCERTFSYRLDYEHILKTVNLLNKLNRYFRVCLCPEFKPL